MTDPARDTTLPSIVEPIAGGSPTATHPCEAAFLRNLTGGRVVVQGAGDVVHLPPLGEIEMSPERIDLFDETVLAGEPRVQLYRAVSPEAEDRASTAVGVVGVVALLVAVGVGVGLGWQWGLLAYAITMVVGLVAGRFLTKVRVGVLVHWLMERGLLLVVLVVGFGSALVAAWLGNLGPLPPAEGLEPGNLERVFLVVIQAIFLGFAITFPALLYFFFERQRAEALRTRFLLNAFRLDDRLTTVTDVEARYGARMKDVFGETGSLVQQSRRSSPILIATTVLSISLVAAFIKLGSQRSAAAATGDAVGSSLLSVLTPTAEVLPFAFLGAYLYAVNTSLRGYMRGDLRPKAYSQVAARMLVVVALAALLTAFTDGTVADWPQALVLTAAFFVGLVPNTFITRMFEVVRQSFSLRRAKVGEPQPLTELQGIDLYDRARLEQEGVTNVEALVHGDLIDLMTQTRIPAGRLVDWLDQAVLHLYAPEAVGDDDQRATIDDLIGRRIRTASQLLEAAGYRLVPRGDGSWVVAPPAQPPASPDDLTAKYRHVIEGIASEPCMRRVLCWKRNEIPGEVVVSAPCTDAVIAPAPVPDAPVPDASLAAALRSPEAPTSGVALPVQRGAPAHAVGSDHPSGVLPR